MPKIISPNIQSLLKYLRKSQLIGISFEPIKLSAHLEFTVGSEGYDVIIQLFQIVHFMLSKYPYDNENFYSGEIDWTSIKDGGKEVLSSLLYPFKEQDGSLASYPSRSLFHLHIEGGVCIEAVCESYQVFQEIKD